MNAGPIGPGNGVPVKVKFDRLIAYSTLQLPLAMAALPVVLNVSHFYGEVLKLSLQIMGPIFIFARIVDAIQDPVIGLISDRFTRRGRRGRLAFVALMIPVLAAGFYMLFDPPDAWFGNQTMMAVWLIGGPPAGPSRLFRRLDQLSLPWRGAHRRLQRTHQGHGRPRGVRPARHDAWPSCCRPGSPSSSATPTAT